MFKSSLGYNVRHTTPTKKKKEKENAQGLGPVAQAFNSSTGEANAGGSL